MQHTFSRGSVVSNSGQRDMSLSPRRSFQAPMQNVPQTSHHRLQSSMSGLSMGRHVYSGSQFHHHTGYRHGREESLGAHSEHSNALNRNSSRSTSVSEDFVGWPYSGGPDATPALSIASSSPSSSMRFTPLTPLSPTMTHSRSPTVEQQRPPSSSVAASSPSDPKGRRGANFDEESLNQLCVSWLHVSQSPLTGNDQQSNVFWGKITNHFNSNVSEANARSQKSVMARWSALNRCMSRFAGCLEQIKRLKESGKSAEDQVTDALALYKSDTKCVFKDISSYNIVKYAPKWQQNPFYLDHCGHSKAKHEDTYSDMDLGTDVDNLPRMDRPIGTKQAKQGKRTRSTLAEEVMPQLLQNSNTVASATRDIAAQGRDAQNTLQSILEFTILTADTSGLDEVTRAEIEARRGRIIVQSRALREAEDE